MPSYPHLYQPLQAGPVTLKNRILMGAMDARLETMPDGSARAAATWMTDCTHRPAPRAGLLQGRGDRSRICHGVK